MHSKTPYDKSIALTSLTDKNLTNPDKSKICYRFVIVFVRLTNRRFVSDVTGGVSDVGNAKDLSV